MCNFRLLGISNLCEHQTKAVFDQKLIVGWGYHKVVLDESGFKVYCGSVDWGFSFLCIKFILRISPDLEIIEQTY